MVLAHPEPVSSPILCNEVNVIHVLYMHDLRATYFRVNPVNLHAM